MKIRIAVLSVLALFSALQVGAQTIDGRVFYDADGDGVRTAGEVGAPRVVVSAFDGSGALASQTASCDFVAVSIPADPPTIPVAINVAACGGGAIGDYSLTGLTAAMDYRIELTWADTFLFGGAQGSTSVGFASTGATGFDFGVLHPEDYCQNNPRIIAGCFVFPPVPWDASSTEPLIVSWPYDDRFTTATNAEIHPHADDLDFGDLGHVLGVTVHRSTRQVFFSAIASAVWPAGGSGIGAVYSADYSGVGDTYIPASAGLFTDLGAAVDLTAQNPVTGGVLDRFGEFGLGGIDFSSDDEVLWAVNMGAGTLVRVPVGDPPVAPMAAAISEIVPTGHGCTNGSFRPSAVATHRDKVYVGGICDASGGTTADLQAIILEYDGVSFTNRMSAPLGFLINRIFPTTSFNMVPWSGADSIDATQPILTNLAFEEDGSLVLGFMPRIMYTTFAQTAGFIVRAQRNVSGDFLLESAGVTGPYTTDARTTWSGSGFDSANPIAGEGPGGSWFYEQGLIYGNDPSLLHPILFSAGVTVVPGTGEVAAGFTDPLSINAFGVRYLDAQDGRGVAGLQFGGLKVALVSDVDAICLQPPLEIGNRLWCDVDADGVQDPGAAEGGIAGVDVVLTCGADAPVTSTTDGQGRYLFTDALYGVANAGDVIPRDASCTINISLTGTNATAINGTCGSLALSPVNQGGVGAGADLRDSDGTLVAGQVEIAVNTGDDGENVHNYDQGFKAPDLGDAPNTYGTTVGGNGPNHVVFPGYSLGATVDGEVDGQPSAGADGDGADEDGVVFAGGMAMAAACSTGNALTATLTNTASVSGANLDAWIDWNGDGDFDHPAEHLFGGTSQSLSSGANALTYDVPCNALTQAVSYARFRLSSAGSLTPLGSAADGEIEDYVFQVKGLDLGDAPDTYGTTLGANGPRHPVVPGYSLGATEDTEGDGQPSVGADGDGSDEDGIAFAGGMAMAGACSTGNALTATLTNTASVSGANLDAWIDWNGDGDFDHPAEHLFGGTSQSLSSGANALTYDVPCDALAQAVSYARFRLSSAGALTPVGMATEGEVEDYTFQVKGLDYGDAPDSYGTTEGADGPAHTVVPGYLLGGTEDAEPNGQPSVGADGDGADEDGITFSAGMAMAAACEGTSLNAFLTNATLAITTAFLDAWIDWNGDGDFDHPAEHLFGGTSALLAAGANSLPFDVPCNVTPGDSYARFRLSSGGGLTPTDAARPAANGEVEDYTFLLKGLDWGDAPAPYATLLVDDGPRHGVLPVNNPTLGTQVDTEVNGQPDATHSGDDLASLDDEDGVVLPTLATPSSTIDIVITALNGAVLNGWIDWNGNGIFGDIAGEAVAVDVALAAGSTTLSADVPAQATAGPVCARFRYSSQGGLAPTGPAPDGEIEDYGIEVLPEDVMIGAAKEATNVVDNGDGSWLVTYQIQVENFGNVPLETVEVASDLSIAFAAAQSFSVESLVASANLTVNPSFDGAVDIDLLDGSDTLAPGEQGSLELIVRLVPGDFEGPYVCSATTTGTSPQGTTVVDGSQDGPSADPDGNDNPTDNEDPTVVILELGTILEIPALGPMGLVMLGLLLAFAAGQLLRRRQSA